MPTDAVRDAWLRERLKVRLECDQQDAFDAVSPHLRASAECSNYTILLIAGGNPVGTDLFGELYRMYAAISCMAGEIERPSI